MTIVMLPVYIGTQNFPMLSIVSSQLSLPTIIVSLKIIVRCSIDYSLKRSYTVKDEYALSEFIISSIVQCWSIAWILLNRIT